MRAKAFLLQECRNVKDLLDDTLQYEYGLDGSGAFFDECTTRLEFITDELNATDEADEPTLKNLARRLNRLAELICRIERSSLGEYSWPFVEELKKVALAVCQEPSVMGPSLPPLIYVLAGGGLDSYAIDPEERKPGLTNRLILTIVFPKSLKHSVLLHSILGHEVGHAIYRCSKHQSDLNADGCDVLNDPAQSFGDEAVISARLFSPTAPAEVQQFVARLKRGGIDENTLFEWASLEAWTEEVLCDLIGLLTFGPSFVAAQCELLYALAPSGAEFGDAHPPVGWRVNAILRCATMLGFDGLPAAGHQTYDELNAFWTDIKSFRRNDSWFDAFTDSQLNDAITGIQKVLAPHDPASYVRPSFDLLSQLLQQIENQTPPVGFGFDTKGNPACTTVDFRHITYAGWIASRTRPSDDFALINRLCEHGIVQQAAIDLSLKKPKRAARKKGP